MNKQKVQQFANKVVEMQDRIDAIYLQLQYIEEHPYIANEGISICQMRSYQEFRIPTGGNNGVFIYSGFDKLAKALDKETEIVRDGHTKSFTYRDLEFYSLED